jgi:hypothetical protein
MLAILFLVQQCYRLKGNIRLELAGPFWPVGHSSQPQRLLGTNFSSITEQIPPQVMSVSQVSGWRCGNLISRMSFTARQNDLCMITGSMRETLSHTLPCIFHIFQRCDMYVTNVAATGKITMKTRHHTTQTSATTSSFQRAFQASSMCDGDVVTVPSSIKRAYPRHRS